MREPGRLPRHGRAAVGRLSLDPRTRAYVARRDADGLSKREILRCLKRDIAREAYDLFTAPNDLQPGFRLALPAQERPARVSTGQGGQRPSAQRLTTRHARPLPLPPAAQMLGSRKTGPAPSPSPTPQEQLPSVSCERRCVASACARATACHASDNDDFPGSFVLSDMPALASRPWIVLLKSASSASSPTSG